jgi:hypothetical protein
VYEIVSFFQIDKIKVRYSAEEAAAHQLSYTVPAAGQFLSEGKLSVQTQPAVIKKKGHSFIGLLSSMQKRKKRTSSSSSGSGREAAG